MAIDMLPVELSIESIFRPHRMVQVEKGNRDRWMSRYLTPRAAKGQAHGG